MPHTRRSRLPGSRAQLPGHIGAVADRLFRAQGYSRVTMEQIADRAGVSKRTLYKYFPVKEALLERMLENALAEDFADRDSSAFARAGFRAGVTLLLRESARWCKRHADILLPYIRYKFASFDPGAARGEDRGLLPLWITLIESAQGRGELRADLPPAQLAMYFHYLYLGALMRWLTGPRINLGREFDTVIGLFMEGASAGARARTRSPR